MSDTTRDKLAEKIIAILYSAKSEYLSWEEASKMIADFICENYVEKAEAERLSAQLLAANFRENTLMLQMNDYLNFPSGKERESALVKQVERLKQLVLDTARKIEVMAEGQDEHDERVAKEWADEARRAVEEKP